MKTIIAAMILTLKNPEPMLIEKNERISRAATIELNGSIEKVFPLFGPVREKEWAFGWDPEIVFGTSEIEEHMIFRTKARYDDEQFYTWIVTKYIPEKGKIEYTVSSTDRIWFITVQCEPLGLITIARVCYTFTSFSESASKRNMESLEKMFKDDLQDWQEAINYYLETGKTLNP
jgi:hypothetical protein